MIRDTIHLMYVKSKLKEQSRYVICDNNEG